MARWTGCDQSVLRIHPVKSCQQGELIIARLSPKGYQEISRARLIKPTSEVLKRKLVWPHPAFANRCIYARNDAEIVCVSLSGKRSD